MIATATPAHPIVGIDVGKRTCHIALRGLGLEPIDTTAPRAETAAAVLDLIADHPPGIIALELTGSLALPIIATLETTPHRLMIAQHTDTAALRRLLRRPRKTDKLDAALIAELAALLTDPATAPLVAAHLTPWPTMRAAILGRATVRHLQALITDRARHRLRAHYVADPLATHHRAATLALLDAQIRETEAALLATAGAAEHLLATIPAVSLRTGCILIAAIGDVTRFPDADHLVSYLGRVPPHTPTSGTVAGRPVRRKGVDLVNTALFMAGLTVARNPARYATIGATYTRAGGGRRGMWAAQRQIVRCCWGVLTSGEPYRGHRAAQEGTTP